MMREHELRDHMVAICHRMYDKGLIAAGDGNVSAKLDEERVLVTPTGFNKGQIKAEDLIVTDIHGKRLKGRHKPSSEFLMHELCYVERADVGAVVHAHPPITVGLALAGVSLAQCVLSETCLFLGAILTAPYSTPTTDEVPNVLRPYIRQSNAVIMDRHGALTVGRDLNEAYNRMEAMEHAARITHTARVLGPVPPLPRPEVDKLADLARSLGIPRAPDPCTLCNVCPNGTGGPRHAALDREGRSTAVIDREGRSTAVIDREGRSTAVIDREGRSTAVIDREGRSTAVIDSEGRSTAVIDSEGRSAEQKGGASSAETDMLVAAVLKKLKGIA